LEQTSGIGQVTMAVTQLDNVTQQNAALVEEAAAAADSLREQATRLVDAVSVFQIRKSDSFATTEQKVKPKTAPRRQAATVAADSAISRLKMSQPKAPAQSPARVAEGARNTEEWVTF